MKKLNKKGFTLIELLAVIVVLAIVLVVTIPSVLSSMGKAKEQQFNNAVATINEYYKKNCEAAAIGDKNLADYNDELFTIDTNTKKCSLIDGKGGGDVATAAGYTYKENEANDSDGKNNKSDFNSITFSNGEVTGATSPEGSKFGTQTYTK